MQRWLRQSSWWIAIATLIAGCRPHGRAGACARIAGTWTGVDAVPDDGGDPSALELVAQMARNDRWRITRVTDTGLQRERISQATGRVVADAMYVREDLPSRCIVDVTTPAGPRSTTFTLRAGDTMEVRTAGAWYVELFQRAR